MSKKSKIETKAPKTQEKEIKRKKSKNAIIITSASIAAAAIIALLAIFVIKPAIEKRKAEKETEQTTSADIDVSEDGYAEYKGCKMPAEFASLLLQADAECEASCNESGVAAEIGEHKLSVPEYAFYYYRSEIDQLSKVANSVYEKGSNFTGFDPSKAPSKQNYPSSEITWEEKLSEKFTSEMEKNYFLFDEAIKSGFMPDEDIIDSINEFFEYLSLSAGGYNSLDDFISDKYFEGLTFAMFCKREIIMDYAEAYEDSLCEAKEESYSDSYVKNVFNKSPEKYKNVTVNVYPIENKDYIDEARNVKDFNGFCNLAKKSSGLTDFNAESQTENYKVTYDDIADFYGDAVADWIFSSERKAGDTGVVAGAVYYCLIYLNELPAVTHSSDILMLNIASDDSKTVDDAYNEAEEIYNQLGGNKMTEEDFREYLSENTDEYEYTAFVNDFESKIDKWVHSEERANGDSICVKGNESACIIMFLNDNPDDTYSNAIIRKNNAYEEIEKYIEDNCYSVSVKKKIAEKGVKIAEEKYLEYYNSNKDKLGV